MIKTRPHMPPQMSSPPPSPPSSSCSSLNQKQQLQETNSSLSTMISPIFHQLLSCLHLINLNFHDDDDDDDDDSGNDNDDQRRGGGTQIIAHLRQLQHLLDQLQNALRAIVENSSGRDGDNLAVSATASASLDRIALPLLDILQHEHWFTIEQNRQQYKQLRGCSDINVDVVGGDTSRGDGGGRCSTNETTEMIRRSVSYSCMEKAAVALSTLWTLRQRTILTTTTLSDNTAVANSTKGITDQYRNSIHKVVLPSLISCAMALSSLDIAGEELNVGVSVIDGDVVAGAGTATTAVELATNTTSPSTTTCTFDKETKTTTQRQSLDRGEDCAMAMLSCIQSLLHFDANDSFGNYDDDVDNGLSSSQHHAEVGGMEEDGVLPPQHLLSQEVGSAMGGALVARLVQGCLSLLSSPMTSSSCAARNKDDTALQLEALKTLHTLLVRVPLPDLWKSILPGTFASLYQTATSRLQSLSSSMYSPSSSSFKSVASVSVRVLSLLLYKSLSSEPPLDKVSQHHEREVIDKHNNIQSITASLMAAVQQSSTKSQPLAPADEEEGGSLSPDAANSMPLPIPPEEEEKKLQDLKTEVNNRLVGPLLVLLSLLPTNRCEDVQISGLYLSQTIMIHVRTIWAESNYKALERKALEICLMMMVGDEGDDDNELKRFSYNILHSYKTINYGEGWKKQLSQTIVPTILELMEPLPTFARPGREMQVRHNLRLINGYLLISFRSMLNGGDFDLDWSSSGKKRKSDIGHAISCTEALKIVKHAFSVLFAPDVDTIACNEITSIHSTLSPEAREIAIYRDSRSCNCRFLYLGDEAGGAASTTVHIFARVLGAKRCAFLIDDCISEIFESYSQSCSDQREGIDRWQQWSGLCIFVSELLRGICGPSKPSTSTSSMHIFSSLASSVLPLIVSDSLWTLPTVLDTGSSISDHMKGQVVENGTSGRLQSGDATSKGQFVHQSASTMNSNAVLISVMMGVIREFTRVLGGNMRFHLPILLFPILERASPIGNHSTVQSAAIATLQDITGSIGYNDISSLIASNFDYLIDVLSLRFRKYGVGKMTMERSCVGVVDLILRSAIHNESPTVSMSESNETVPIAIGHVSMASNLLNSLLSYLDRQPSMTNLSVLDAARVLQSMCTFMDSSIDVHLSKSTPVIPEVEDCDPFQRLDFELFAESTGHACDDCFDDDITALQSTMNDNTEPTDETLLLDESHNARENDRDETICMQEVNAINTILSRCCYLLCYSNLQLQVICCETIRSGFHSLGKIGSLQKKLHGEAADSPLFRAIAEFWPPIIARLRSTSTFLGSANRLSRSELSVRNMMAADQAQGYHSQAGLEVLMSKLLSIISELCLSSDGFFADRFQNDAYPILATLMSDLLPTLSNSRIHPHQPSTSSEQKQSLLLALLHCLKCAFESDCRYGLAGLIPTAGTMLLPLLAFRGIIRAEATNALKAMILVDSDVLWRELHMLSGKPFPCNPLLTLSSSTSTTSMTVSNNYTRRSSDFTLSQQAVELLEFIECLPEQEL